MRKIIYYIVSLALVALISCEYNDEYFPGLDELAAPVDIKNKDLVLTEADYAAISNLSANKTLATQEGVYAELSNLKTTQTFSSALKAARYIPNYLASLYMAADDKSVVRVTYNYQDEAPAHLAELAATGIYTLSTNDYKTVWSGEPILYLTPEKPLSRFVNTFLTTAYPDAEAGTLKAVVYNYSEEEPGDFVDPVPTQISEDFSSITANAQVELASWVNYVEKGSKGWEGKLYDGNLYPQFSAFGAGGEAIAWLITPEVNLSQSVSPTLSFDVNIGYFNAYLLQVLVSQDYAGGDPNEATWEDVTHHFAFYNTGNSNTNLYIAGMLDMSGYKDNNVRVAFRYAGDANNSKTSTYQIDNVQLGDDTDIAVQTVFAEGFENGLDAWDNITLSGTKAWSVTSYQNDYRAVFSAHNADPAELQDGWLVSPGISVPAEGHSQLSLNLVVGYYNHDCLSVLVSDDYAGDVEAATWTDVTDAFVFPQNATNYSPVLNVGAASLNAFKGKDIVVALRYQGDNSVPQSTTYQIYDVKVNTYTRAAKKSASMLKAATVQNNIYTLYRFNGSAWQPENSAVILSPSDYTAMGISYFSSSNPAENYLPTFLKSKFPYALEEDSKNVLFFDGQVGKFGAQEYILTGGVWKKNDARVVVTDQFVKANGVWVWDPSVVINLAPIRNDAFIMAYYQAASDWVWENIDVPGGAGKKGDGYVSSYGNNEYYAGTSAYYNNVDWRVQAARNQSPSGYPSSMSDDEVKALLKERLIEVMGKVLEIMHPNVAPIDGVDITYTFNVAIYEGTTVTDVTHTIVYKLVGVGKFEYVEDSFKKIGE